jgi:hypothetical protein
MPVILTTQEEEIRRITVRSQPGEIVCKTLSGKTLHKTRASGVAQREGLQFKSQYLKKQANNSLLRFEVVCCTAKTDTPSFPSLSLNINSFKRYSLTTRYKK